MDITRGFDFYQYLLFWRIPELCYFWGCILATGLHSFSSFLPTVLMVGSFHFAGCICIYWRCAYYLFFVFLFFFVFFFFFFCLFFFFFFLFVFFFFFFFFFFLFVFFFFFLFVFFFFFLFVFFFFFFYLFFYLFFFVSICCLVDMRRHRSCLPDTITFLGQPFIDFIITQLLQNGVRGRHFV